MKKPPLGLMPHHIWLRIRIRNITNAIRRYRYHSMDEKPEWKQELKKLKTQLRLCQPTNN